MARVKRGVTARRRHKKILKQAKGYYHARRKVFRVAKQAVTKALQYAYIGRKQKKRNFRSLWITRINAAARINGMSYSLSLIHISEPTMARCSITGWRFWLCSSTYSAPRRPGIMKSTCMVPSCQVRPMASLRWYSILGP